VIGVGFSLPLLKFLHLKPPRLRALTTRIIKKENNSGFISACIGCMRKGKGMREESSTPAWKIGIKESK
jgi:hypothetical protein